MSSCDNEHALVHFEGEDCPMCAHRRTLAETQGWNLVRDLLASQAAGAAPTPRAAGGEVRIGVVIPVRDRDRPLGRCLDGLRAQTRQPQTVQVVDLGSEPSVPGALRVESETWIKGRAINAGLRALRGCTHALLLDVDLILHPETLTRIAAWLATHGAVAVAPLDIPPVPEGFAFDFAAWAAIGRPRGPDQVGGCVAYPLDWLLRTGGMDESYVGRGYHDLDLWERARRDLPDPLYVSETEGLALHQQHPVTRGPEVDENRRRFDARWRRGGIVRRVDAPEQLPAPRGDGVLVPPEPRGHSNLGRRRLVVEQPAAAPASQPPALPPPDVPLTCSAAGPGQSALIDGLSDLGFVAVSPELAAQALREGRRVLFHGTWAEQEQTAGRPVVLWHSGLTGSDLMGEGAALASMLARARRGECDLLWLESRDELPRGATGRMVPVWSPARMRALVPGPAEKIPGSLAVGFCGRYPSAAKNTLAAADGCACLGEIHISASSLDGVRGQAVRAVLEGSDIVVHDFLPRDEAVALLARMDLLVHPSTSDTWPYLVMEAIYVGTPALLSEAVAWTTQLPEWAQAACVVRPSISSAAIRRLATALLEDADLRARVLEAQRAVLDGLAPRMREQAADCLRAAGFRLLGDPAPVAVFGPPWIQAALDRRERDAAPVTRYLDGRRDLCSEITAFLVSSGEPSVADCRARLEAQDCRIRIEEVAGVAPMDRAFQQMLDRCQTPYYVQIDADMLLEPWAVSTLYETMRAREAELAAGPDSGLRGCAQVVGWLWGDDVERPIQGVKLYRHDVCYRYPYVGELSCEMGQNGALRRDGWEILGMQLGDQDVGDGTWRRTRRTLGLHFAMQTPEMTFRRARRLLQKHRALPWMGWIGEYVQRWEAEWLAEPANEIKKARYLGAVSALTGPLPEGEVDASLPDQDYRRVAAYVGEYSHGPRELSLYLTDACNFACHFGDTPCRRETETGVPHNGTMTPETLRATLDRWPSIRSCCIAGFGEPLLHPDLPGLCAVLSERGIGYGIISNGSLLEKRVEMLRGLKGLLYVSVSLNASTAAEHEEMSRTKLWPRVLAGIRAVLAAGLRVGVSHVVTVGNAERLPAFLGLARDLGVRFVHLHNPLPHAGPEDEGFLGDVIRPSSTEARAAIETARHAPGAELVEVWPQPVDLDAGPPGGGACMSPLVSIGVDAKMQVTGCRRIDPPGIEMPNGSPWPTPAPGLYHPWRAPHFTELIAAVTGDRPAAHPACRACFGASKG